MSAVPPSAAAQIQCPQCGFFASPNLTFCPACGGALSAAPAAADAPAPASAGMTPHQANPPIPANEQLMPSPVQQQPVPASVYCTKCGTAFGSELTFCPNCGTPRGAVGAPTPVRTDMNTPVEGKATNAMIAEIIGGYLGFMGIGHIMGGNTVLGLAIMVGWWVCLGIIVGISLTGCGLILSVPAYFGIPVASGMLARNNIRDNVAMLR